jgi:hypothetical protein
VAIAGDSIDIAAYLRKTSYYSLTEGNSCSFSLRQSLPGFGRKKSALKVGKSGMMTLQTRLLQTLRSNTSTIELPFTVIYYPQRH